MELVFERGNVKAALKRVRQHKGGPGIDGMTMDEPPRHLVEHWENLRGQLLAGTYQPKPLKRQEIPKSGGGIRELGIPSAVDRFIQQAILQVLQPRFDPAFSKLERRGHAFARYADDCNVYGRSKRAGERVMERLRRLYSSLQLRINDTTSAVARPWDRKFLGYSFWVAKGREIKRKVAPRALEAMKEGVREITSRNGGLSIDKVIAELRGYLLGWKEYFRLADTLRNFESLDEWIRRRLRMVQIKQWKRGSTPSENAERSRRGCRDLPRNLHRPNRPVRTRMPGGVGGR
jgi:hypothetical protein